jgi:hypothetical protein
MLGFFHGDERAFSGRACEFWQAGRIPHSPLSPRTRFERWLHTDSEENYYARGNRDFSVESVGYEFNSLGYRGPELALQPGEAGVVFLGDSNTLGLGMPWDSIWTSLVTRRLQERWGVAVRPVNLAWSATGSDYTAMMIHQTVDELRPAAVFILWSFVGRMTWFPDPRNQVHFIPEWTSDVHADSHAAYLRLATEAHGFFNFVRNFQFVHERLSRLDIPCYWGHLEQFSRDFLAPYVPLDRFVGSWEAVDVARDARHAGVQSHLLFADRVMAAVARDGVGVPAVPPRRRTRPARGASARPFAARLVTLAPRSLRHRFDALRLAWRVRAMKRKDPFIY